MPKRPEKHGPALASLSLARWTAWFALQLCAAAVGRSGFRMKGVPSSRARS